VLRFRSTEAVRAENLFLRHQLALFIERGLRPRRVDAATRISLVVLAKLFEWRGARKSAERVPKGSRVAPDDFSAEHSEVKRQDACPNTSPSRVSS